MEEFARGKRCQLPLHSVPTGRRRSEITMVQFLFRSTDSSEGNRGSVDLGLHLRHFRRNAAKTCHWLSKMKTCDSFHFSAYSSV